MSTDRELLELAAKAAGIEPASFNGMDVGWHVPGRGIGTWNPLTDDGDALRLAAKLQLDVDHEVRGVWVSRAGCEMLRDPVGEGEEIYGDEETRLVATRRAIVRAAAATARATGGAA